MADKGFDIHNDLNKLDLKLNIPPYLKDKVGFGEDDVIKHRPWQGIEFMWRGLFAR